MLLNRHDRGKLTGNGKLLLKFLGATSLVSLGPRSRPAGANQEQIFWYTRLDPKTGTKSYHILVSLNQTKRFASQFEVDSKDKFKGQQSGPTIYPRSSKPRYAEKRYETSLPRKTRWYMKWQRSPQVVERSCGHSLRDGTILSKSGSCARKFI